MGVQIHQGEETILGSCPGHSKALAIFTAAVAAAFTAKGITQLPITSCSRRDHSVYQASANSIRKISGRLRCGLSTTKGEVGLHSAGEVWYLRLPWSWLGSVVCVWFSALTLLVRWQKGHLAFKNLFHYLQSSLFQTKWRPTTEETGEPRLTCNRSDHGGQTSL